MTQAPNSAAQATSGPVAPPRIDLEGRVAVVTGASRGIGRAVAETLAAAGAAIVPTARREESLDELVDSLRAAGRPVHPVAAHAGEPGAGAAIEQEAIAAFGGVDILVNNAGTCPHFGPVLEADDGLWDKTMDVNVRGAWRAVQACAPLMRERGGGVVINIASIAGLIPQTGVGLYCLSKAALVMLGRVLAAELAADGIRVHTVAPGFVRTRFSRALWSDDVERERTLADIPQRRIGSPQEIANAVAFLASDLTPFATGDVLVIDGGQMVAAGQLP
jgi:NAD(P)-dependent dehydrogenase (short-subunit alcohol dehydrogenase family)